MTCSYSKEYSTSAFTDVENEFITIYLPSATGDAVKVYLYGLYLCAHPDEDKDISAIAAALNITDKTVLDSFMFWEEVGIISILTTEPLTVSYLPVKETYHSRSKKYKAEKYSDFAKAVQSVISGRMISTSEYTEYFDIMETYSIKPEAMFMIVKYCTDMKGNDIGYRYISTVAKNFGNKGITTIEQVEKELASYLLHTAELEKILRALSSRKKPEPEDQTYYKKWTKELSFEPANIVFAAKTLKRGNMEKLDAFLMELYAGKHFSKQEIASYAEKKQAVYNLALKINRALSVYVDIIETEIDNYIAKWLSYGYEESALLAIATHCFLSGKSNLADMDDLVETLRKNGFIDLSAVTDYFEEEKKADAFISKMLITCGLNRRPTPWDRQNLATWKIWNFSDEMILEAAKLSSGKNSPVAYMNGILSRWKNQGVFDLSSAETIKTNSKNISQEEYNREYARRRGLAASKAQKNVESALELDGFMPVYERLSSIEKDMAFAEMSENSSALSQLEQEKLSLTDKANKILSSINLTLQDLSPHYACEKCNDTGYVGQNRCDCFDKKQD